MPLLLLIRAPSKGYNKFVKQFRRRTNYTVHKEYNNSGIDCCFKSRYFFLILFFSYTKVSVFSCISFTSYFVLWSYLECARARCDFLVIVGVTIYSFQQPCNIVRSFYFWLFFIPLFLLPFLFIIIIFSSIIFIILIHIWTIYMCISVSFWIF